VIRPIRTARPASEEMTAAVRWYEEQRRGLGAAFFDAVLTTLDRITENPEIGAAIPGVVEARRVFVGGSPTKSSIALASERFAFLLSLTSSVARDFGRLAADISSAQRPGSAAARQRRPLQPVVGRRLAGCPTFQ
jgi:plasmid stabilization system protein ParE